MMALKTPALLNAPRALQICFPHLAPSPSTCEAPPIGAIALGRSDGKAISLSRRTRQEHCHVIGTTGGGKTNALEAMIRQDIKNGDGVFVVDPHGNHKSSLYRSLVSWIFAGGHHRGERFISSIPMIPGL